MLYVKDYRKSSNTFSNMRALKFSERPDYDYLRGLFSNLRQEAGEAREGLKSLTHHFSNDFNDFINLKSDSSGTQDLDPGMGMGMRM